jgi:hypothetical protein
MLEDGLGYPVRGDWIGRIIIGGVLGFFSFLVLPIFAIQGYLFKVMEGTIAGEDTPPAFTDWGELLVRGIGVTVIGIAYSVLPVLAYGFVAFSFLGVGGYVGGDAGGLLAGVGVLSFFLLLPVLLFVYYVIPAAVANYASTGELASGFAFSEILSVVTTGEYLLAVLLPIVVGVVLVLAAFVLAITVVGVLFIPFLEFYGQVAVFRMFGSAYRSVRP